MWTVDLLTFGVFCCTVSTSLYVSPVSSSSLASPSNVTFNSVNLRNVLHWVPGNGTTDETRFTVQYAIYGDAIKGGNGRQVNWRPVRHCTNIVRSQCDLTNETWNLENGYFARVRALGRGASSKWAVNRVRFDPKSSTDFGPPVISVEAYDNTVIVTLKGPMRYQPNHQTPAVSMAELYPQMAYNLSRYDTRNNLMRHLLVTSSTHKFSYLVYDTEYCFSAQARFISMPIHCQNSEWHCITTPQDPVIGQLRRVIVGIVVPSLGLCLIGVLAYILHRYLTVTERKCPYCLKPSPLHAPPSFFYSEKPIFNPINEIKPTPSYSVSPEPRERRHPDPRSGYSPQGPNIPLQPEEDRDDLSPDYGAVCVCQEWENTSEKDGSQVRKEQPAPSYAPQTCRPTQLQTSAEADGGLILGAPNQSQEDRDRPGIYVNRDPQTGLFDICLNQTWEEWKAEGVTATEDGRIIVYEEEEERESQEVLLLPAYAWQNSPNSTASNPDAEDSDEYAFLLGPDSTCIKWDPVTGKFMFPMLKVAVGEEGGAGGSVLGEGAGEEGEEEERELAIIDSVFVRQASEESEEAERGEQANDFLSKWNLVLPTDL